MRVLPSGPRWVVGGLLVSPFVLCAFLLPPTPTSLLAETIAEPPRLEIDRCRVRLRDDVRLAAERTGIVAAVLPEGRSVEAGSLVGRLRDHAARKAFAVAERDAANDVEVRYARKKAELAELRYARALQANSGEEGTVPELELRQLRLEAEQSLLQIEQAEHHLAVARLRRDEQAELLRTYVVTAPFGGVVTKVHAKPGEVVREGDPIAEIASTDVLEVHGHVPLDLVASVAVDTPIVVSVTLTDAEGRRTRHDFPGRVTTVDVRVEPVTRRVAFKADVVNVGGRLRDGLAATVVVRSRE